jgi:hypothetical protein
MHHLRFAAMLPPNRCVRWFRTTIFRREDVDQFSEYHKNTWQEYDSAREIGADEIKRWPLHERIDAAGTGYINIARKTRNALRQIDRILDVFEPGQLALSFNGGKDSTVLMHLFIAACAQHPTHSFTHIQPIWFRHPDQEFPELVKYVEETAEMEFTHPEGLKGVDGRKLSRLWTMHIREPQVHILYAVFCMPGSVPKLFHAAGAVQHPSVGRRDAGSWQAQCSKSARLRTRDSLLPPAAPFPLIHARARK